MAKYRILSIDGGGIRGLLAARILERLDIQEPKWLPLTAMMAGTSTGGIIALALASGMTPHDIGDFYRKFGATIFDDSLLDDILDLGKLIGADYTNKGLQRVLTNTFGQLQLKDLKKRVTIPTFDLDNNGIDDHGKPVVRRWKPKIFHNFPGDDSDGARLVKEVALFTSAAPTYFPSYKGYVDGGVFANNPSIVALAQALSSNNRPADRAKIEDIVMLSIGTGTPQSYLEGERLNWGRAQWAIPLISLLMDGVAGIADFQAKQLLGLRYHRIQVDFAKGEKLETDSIDKMDRLEELATQCDLTESHKWIQDQWLN